MTPSEELRLYIMIYKMYGALFLTTLSIAALALYGLVQHLWPRQRTRLPRYLTQQEFLKEYKATNHWHSRNCSHHQHRP